MKQTVTLKVFEVGNGFPAVGEIVGTYTSDGEAKFFKVLEGKGRIFTRQWCPNWCYVDAVEVEGEDYAVEDLRPLHIVVDEDE